MSGELMVCECGSETFRENQTRDTWQDFTFRPDDMHAEYDSFDYGDDCSVDDIVCRRCLKSYEWDDAGNLREVPRIPLVSGSIPTMESEPNGSM